MTKCSRNGNGSIAKEEIANRIFSDFMYHIGWMYYSASKDTEGHDGRIVQRVKNTLGQLSFSVELKSVCRANGVTTSAQVQDGANLFINGLYNKDADFYIAIDWRYYILAQGWSKIWMFPRDIINAELLIRDSADPSITLSKFIKYAYDFDHTTFERYTNYNED
jgi:hypothetical protein